ncbi:MAG: DNA repair protein RadA [Nitrospinota bacterium]|nr:DNA repair protein RadA [Nitrospinota bacterium]
MAKKARSQYVCQECGSSQPKWIGRCPDCNSWNTFQEEAVKPVVKRGAFSLGSSPSAPVPLSDLPAESAGRKKSGIVELDRVLGGGVVDGSLVLIGGDPGIGKSTLVLQLCGKLAANSKVLYVTGEESPQQVKIRADRLGIDSASIYVFPETNVEIITARIEELMPSFVVVDSVQTVFTEQLSAAPGSVGQLREATSCFMRTAKTLNVPLFLVGHVTKDGAIAGPRVLEHMVDTVLYFEGDKDHSFRILRSVKNRFGSTQEIGVFEMRGSGLVEVENPSELFINSSEKPSSGSVITCTLSGTRPILVELQSLVTPTSFGNPRRTAVGFDYNRLVLLAAILQKRAGLMLDVEDIYVSAAGGVRIEDPGSDLAVSAAIAGSFRNISVAKGTVFIGEVGLGGEVRPVSSLEVRLKEAQRMGMKRAVVPAVGAEKLADNGKLKIVGIKHVDSLLENIF